jgi:hypothetical protein
MIEEIKTTLIVDATAALNSMAKVEQMSEGIRREFDTLKKSEKDLFDPAAKSANELEGDIQALNAELGESADAFKKQNTEIGNGSRVSGGFIGKIKDMVSNTNVLGKSVGEWKSELSGTIGKLSEGAAGSAKLSGAMRILGLAIKATGIGLLISAVAAAIAFFTRFQGGIDKVSQVMAGASAVINVLLERIVTLGGALFDAAKGIVSFITLDFDGAAESFSSAGDGLAKSVNGLGKELVDAAEAAYNLEQQFQQLRDSSLTASVEVARLKTQAAQLKNIAEDETLAIGKRTRAAQTAAGIEKQIADQRLDESLTTLDLERQKFALSTKTYEDKVRLADAEKGFQESQIERNNVIFEAEKQQREFRKQAFEERKKQREEERRDLEKLAKDLEKLRVEAEPEGIDRDLAAVNKKYDDLQKITKAGVDKLNEIEKRRTLSPEELAQRQEFGDLSVQLEAQRLSAIIDVLADFNEQEAQLEEDQTNKRKELSEKEKKELEKSIEEKKKIRDTEIDIAEQQAEAFLLRLEQQGANEEEIKKAKAEFDLQIQAARLRSEIEFQQAILAATDAGDKDRIEQITKSIEALQGKLSNITFQIENPKPGKKGGFDIFKLLGLDPNDPEFENQKKALEKAAGDIIGIVEGLADARVEAADREVDAAERRVSAAQDALEVELDLAEQGFASNVTLRQKELADAEAAQAKALENQKKAQKAQLILDTITQGTGLITAAANIFKGFSSIPIVGVPLAIAAIGLMLGAFAKAKIDAFKATKFREGGSGRVNEDGVIVGPSHDNGGVTVPEYEGGEFFTSDGNRFAVVNRKMTGKHFDLLRAINHDEKPEIARLALELSGAGGSTPIRFDSSTGTRIETQKAQTAGVKQNRELDELKESNKLLRENNRLLSKMLKGKDSDMIVGKSLVKRRGNTTTTITNAL